MRTKKALGAAALWHSAPALAASAVAVSVATADWAMTVFGVPATVMFAVFAGAVIAVRLLPEAGRFNMFLYVIIGTIAGGYSTPAAADFLGVQHIKAVGFFSGLLSYSVMTFAFSKGPELLYQWLSKGGK